MKVVNPIRLILDDQGNHLESYTISLESFRSPSEVPKRKPVTGQELFFAVSYSKPALRAYCSNMYTVAPSDSVLTDRMCAHHSSWSPDKYDSEIWVILLLTRVLLSP